MTGPNAERAYAVLDQIDARPELWDQQYWLEKTDCGTAGCYAGWTTQLAGDQPEWRYGRFTSWVIAEDGERWFIESRAADLLGIALEEADALFDEYNTREDLGRLVAEILGPRPGGDGHA